MPWFDGVCKTCESPVEEQGSEKLDFDYMNRCTNATCKNHEWHFCGDQEELEYYEHKR
jgi:hypothetical protein